MKPPLFLFSIPIIFFQLSGSHAKAQSVLRAEDLRVLPAREGKAKNQEILFDYLLRLAEQASARGLERFQAIQTESDLRKWQDTERQKFLELIGGLPKERTPLHSSVVGSLQRDGYTVGKVIFESLPGFFVTVNLYIPTIGKPPYPAVLSPCGHSENGKAFEEYQHLYIGLAKRGYVVLSYDPLGQGERYQYWDLLTNRRRFGFNEHGMAGIQQYLLGQNLARYRIWDGIRALDYLENLPEVDRDRIGCTGNSGGGTLTTYLSMLDSRIKAVSVVTFITSLYKKIEARIQDAESDPEQDIQGLLAAGIDHPEMLGMIAPRPVLIGAAKRDFFPIEGTRDTFKKIQQLYATLAQPERIQMVEFDHGHAYSQPLREATAAWFDRWLKGAPGRAVEPAMTIEPDAQLRCTPTGQVVSSFGGKRIQDFNKEEAERLLAELDRRRNSKEFSQTLLEKLRFRLSLPAGPMSGQVQEIGSKEIGDLSIGKVVLESEPGIPIPLRLIRSRSSQAKHPVILYLRDRSGKDDSLNLFETLAHAGWLVAVADVRGFGETQSTRRVPDPRVGYYDSRDGMDADYAYAALMLGRPLLGMRVWDSLTCANYLKSRTEVDSSQFKVAGLGWAGTIAMLTAVLDPSITKAVMAGVPVSLGQIALSEVYTQPVSQMADGMLKDFDLPDILAGLCPRRLLILNPVDSVNKKMDEQGALLQLRVVQARYRSSGFEDRLEIKVVPVNTAAQNELIQSLLN